MERYQLYFNIASRIKTCDEATFYDLINLEGFKGDCVLFHAKRPNIILWSEISEMAVKILDSMQKNRSVSFSCGKWQDYSHGSLTDEIPTRLKDISNARECKEKRWLPITLRFKGRTKGIKWKWMKISDYTQKYGYLG